MNTTSVGPDKIGITFDEAEGTCSLCLIPLLQGEISYEIKSTSMEQGLSMHAMCFMHLYATMTQLIQEHGVPVFDNPQEKLN